MYEPVLETNVFNGSFTKNMNDFVVDCSINPIENEMIEWFDKYERTKEEIIYMKCDIRRIVKQCEFLINERRILIQAFSSPKNKYEEGCLFTLIKSLQRYINIHEEAKVVAVKMDCYV